MRAEDTEATLSARVLAVEHRIYPLALKWVVEGRIRVMNGRCLIDGEPVPGHTRQQLQWPGRIGVTGRTIRTTCAQ